VLTRDVVGNRPFLDLRGIGCVEDEFYGWRLNLLKKAGPLAFLVRKSVAKNIAKLEQQLAGYDLAVLTGGDNMSSDYGSPSQWFRPIRRLVEAGVPVVMLGQSIGPFRKAEHRQSFVEMAKQCALVTVRETASLRYVLDDLGLPEALVRLTADTAFLLEPAPRELALKMIASFGVEPGRPLIALSVSGGIAGFAAADGERHLAALERLTRRVLAETDATILVLPHVEDQDPNNNDLIVADRLMRRMDFDPRLRLARGFLTSNEFKAIVACCDMVVAERMHVAIGGLSSGIPTFVIGYSVKGHGIMSDVFGVDSLEEGLVTPLSTFVETAAADDQILAVWRDRQRLAATLKSRLPEIRERAKQNFSALIELPRA
jgi:colanic acid/amylovoran biosynthesis protein